MRVASSPHDFKLLMQADGAGNDDGRRCRRGDRRAARSTAGRANARRPPATDRRLTAQVTWHAKLPGAAVRKVAGIVSPMIPSRSADDRNRDHGRGGARAVGDSSEGP